MNLLFSILEYQAKAAGGCPALGFLALINDLKCSVKQGKLFEHNNTLDDPAYLEIKDYVTVLQTKPEAYDVALQLAANRGKEEVHAKNLAKAE